jgi:DNA polymerase elongation subunit (family B)
MSFTSDDVENYLRVFDNPNLALRLFESKKGDDRKTITTEELDRFEEEQDEYIMSEDSVDQNITDSDKSAETVDSDVKFQILDVDSYHRVDDDGNKHFDITLFGKTPEDESVFVNVEGFTPYFFVEIDSHWRKEIVERIINSVRKQVYPKECRDGLLSYKVIQAHKFNGFTNDAYFNYLHLVFKDYDSFRKWERVFAKKLSLPFISREQKIKLQLYESNIHPTLRFMHLQDIDPIGWVNVPKEAIKPLGSNHRKGTTDISIGCSWKHIKGFKSDDIHKFKILSFDLECTSGDGKFPQAERPDDKIIQIGMTYSYLGETECHQKIVLCLKKTADIPGAEVICFKDEASMLLKFTDLIRETDPDIITGYNIFGFDWPYINKRAELHRIQTKFNRLSRIRNQVCQFKEQKLQSSALGRNNLRYYITPGRVSIDLMKVIQRDYKLGSYKLDSVAGTFIRDDVKAYDYIRSDDPNIDDYLHLLDDEEDIDEVIQKRKKRNAEDDDDDCYSSDEEDDVDEDVDVETKAQQARREAHHKNKRKKKIRFTRLHVKSTFGVYDDDYISIYNNDGVVDNQIGKKYRILKIDEITKIGKDGKETKVPTILVEGKVRVRPFLKRGWKVFWCQAKDDIAPQDIFRYFKGVNIPKNKVAEYRAKIAKYCLKDCSLCNRLLAILQILPNNIGMGNVCSVPLSYLFLRGQGIKIYSLVAKQCRKENYLIPTNKKPFKKEPEKDADGNIIETEEEKQERRLQLFVKSLMGRKDDEDEDDEDDTGYEGATVFDPIKGVHMDPIIVDDYGSLYPSSMIMKNLSHNSIVLDPRYDNLPGYKYHDVTYNNPDGTTTTCRFAEKLEGGDIMERKATIPRILMKLLSARKDAKKKLAIEKDSFKRAVWDGLQLAYKITANSLYGQCGSSFSPIAMKSIAACTTAIGRDMLELAKDFVEGPMTDIIRLGRDAVESGDDTKFIRYFKRYYKDVEEERIKQFKPKKDDDGNKVLDENGEPVMVPVYEGKDEWFQFVKIKLYDLLGKYDINPETIYGDTDSVFFKLNMTDRETGKPFRNHDALKIAIQVGILTSQIVNYTLEYPQVLEYEKTYWPFCIISKKRYVGNLYEFDPNKYKQKSMGLVTKRRDNADIVKVVVGGIINQILNEKSPEGAIKFTQARLKRIITGQYGIDKFIITKTLKDKEDYKIWQNQVHMVVGDRMAQRDPGNKPQANDRLPYAFIETKKKVKVQGDRAEHPAYIQKHNLKLDYLYYITNQIMKPALQFLELLCENPDDIFHQYIIRETHRKNGQTPIMQHFQDCGRDMNSMAVNFGGKSLLEMMSVEKEEITKMKSKSKSRKKRDFRQRVARKRIV